MAARMGVTSGGLKAGNIQKTKKVPRQETSKSLPGIRLPNRTASSFQNLCWQVEILHQNIASVEWLHTLDIKHAQCWNKDRNEDVPSVQKVHSLEGGMSGRNFNFLYSFKNYRRVTVKRKNILSQFRVMVNFLLHSSTEGKKKLPVALKAEMS